MNNNEAPFDSLESLEFFIGSFSSPNFHGGSEKLATKQEILKEIDMMVDNLENLPQEAMMASASYYDLYSVLVLVAALFRASSSD